MCQFKVIVPEEKGHYDVIVFAESYESPFYHLDDVAEVIRANNIHKARVLFDTLLSIGNTSERFTEAVFLEEFDMASFQFVELKKCDNIRKMCARFFYENSGILEYSILTPVQKELLKRGAVI